MNDQKMTIPDDLVLKIISHLPLKFAVQCTLLNKNFYTRISDPKFSQTLSQHQKISTLISSSYEISEVLHKISLNSTSVSHCEMTLPVKVNVLATSKGIILIDFYEFMNYCVFNPITGAYQLIWYPDNPKCFYGISDPGLFVDYPTSDKYMVVTVSLLTEAEGYKFNLFSSERSSMWREFQLRMNLGNNTSLSLHLNTPIYVHDSFHWLRCDGSVLAFHTKKEEATIIDLPELNIDYHNPFRMEWLGVVHGLLTLVCTVENSIVIAAYDYANNEWSVSNSMTTNFMRGLDYYNYCFPVWIDNKHVFLQVKRPQAHDHDSEIKKYKIIAASEKYYAIFHNDFYAFAPTLASVHTMLSHEHVVHRKQVSSITATLDKLKRFIRDNIN